MSPGAMLLLAMVAARGGLPEKLLRCKTSVDVVRSIVNVSAADDCSFGL